MYCSVFLYKYFFAAAYHDKIVKQVDLPYEIIVYYINSHEH